MKTPDPICSTSPCLQMAVIIGYLVGLVAGLAPGMSNGALSRQHTQPYVNPSPLNYLQPISVNLYKPIYYETQDHVIDAAVGILYAGNCAAGR